MTAPASAYIDPTTGAVGDPFAAFETPGASYIDPVTGQPIQGAKSAPVGTPYYQSSQLVRDPSTGATYSGTGTAENPFAGFVDAVGGGFGYDGPVDPTSTDPSDPANPNRGLYMDAASSDPTRIATALNSTDPVAQAGAIERLTAPAATGSNQLGALEDSTYASAFTPAWFQSLTPAAQAQVTAGLKASGGDPQAIDQQLANLGAGGNLTKLGGDASGTYIAAAGSPEALAAQQANAASLAQDAATPAPPPVDPDPFGQFDSAQNPTHGVITPQYEAALAAQSQQKLINETAPGAVAPSPGASATAPASAPAIAAPPPATAAFNPQNTTISDAGGSMVAPPTQGAITGITPAPSTVNPADPFAPFIDPTTGQPMSPPSGTAPVQAPTFTASY